MKTIILFTTLLLSVQALKGICQLTESKVEQNSNAMNRATKNEKVLVIIVYIKPEMKTEFDIWIKDVLYSALYKSKSEMKKAQLKATRWLEPVKQNRDGTWTYCWIMDPLIPKTDYEIITFLKKEYGDEAGQKHWNTYLTFMAKEPIEAWLIQTDL